MLSSENGRGTVRRRPLWFAPSALEVRQVPLRDAGYRLGCYMNCYTQANGLGAESKAVAYGLLGLGKSRSGGYPISPALPPIAPLTD